MSSFSFDNYVEAIKALQEAGTSFVSVTLVKQVGSSPQDLGARMLVSEKGLEYGTIGGGKVEKQAIEEAQALLTKGQPHFYAEWNLQKDIGMTCGGVVGFFFEYMESKHPFHIWIFGAGHIAQELVRLLLRLDCRVTCVDSRPEWLRKLPESHKLNTVCTENMAELVHSISEGAYITLMTMGHATDLPILTEVMKQRSRFKYVGNIGSETKALRLRQDLLSEGLPESCFEGFFCPIGEDFGSNSPAEIAISIVAQILKIRDIK